jgi:thiol-disulfide isomerase/thioredoxin
LNSSSRDKVAVSIEKAKKEAYITFAVLGLVVVVVLVYVFVLRSSKEDSPVDTDASRALATKEGQAPFTTLEGDPVDIAQRGGEEIVIATSWASWCPPCVEELAKLDGLAEEYASPQVRFLAINRSEPAHTARTFLRSVGYAGNLTLIIDEDDRYFKATEGYNMPETVMYDFNEQLIYQSHGSLNTTKVRALLDEVLQQQDRPGD